MVVDQRPTLDSRITYLSKEIMIVSPVATEMCVPVCLFLHTIAAGARFH